MSYIYSEQNRDAYFRDGYTILRDLIPTSLLTDLRRESDKAREIARTQHGPSAQRLQPVYRYPELNHQPFRDFLDLPELRATVLGILGPEHGPSDIMGILLEPAEKAWCTPWHRDWGYNVPKMDVDAFFDTIAHPGMFNQLNAALWDDHSLWAVPGSDSRRDTPEERAAFDTIPPKPPVLTDDLTDAQRERACLAHCRRMPGAQPIVLFAGDCAFYRASNWHLGNYVPYAKRATLHDGFYGPADYAWREQVKTMQAR